MISAGEQLELDKCRVIAVTAIAYSIEKKAGLLQPDQLEYYRNFHSVWKEQIEKLYQEKALLKLQKLLENLTVTYKITGDLDFVKYIKEKTGHDFDMYGNIYERIDKIITRKRIANRKERKDVATMLELYRSGSIEQENAAVLISLQIAFDNNLDTHNA